MTEFRVECVRIGPITKHPNADTLSITDVLGGYPCIHRTGDVVEGDLAAYVPVDAIVPEGDERFAFLGVHRRIKAKKLRGIFSMGLLIKAEPGWEEGQDLREILKIEKYEPAIHLYAGQHEEGPGNVPLYTDIEGYRRHKDVLVRGEEVVLTEKIHGANARYFHDGERLWCGSRQHWKKQDARSIWWRAAEGCGLAEALKQAPGLAFYGEAYGQVQDLRYGAGQGEVRLRFFDVLDVKTGRYLDHDDAQGWITHLGLTAVPTFLRGPWDPELMLPYAEGKSSMPGANHVREGFVVKPVKERYDPRVGRVILKMVGEGYHLRKEG